MRRHALALMALLVACCNRDPEIVTRSVVVYSLRSCPVSDQSSAVISANGDFDKQPTSSRSLRDVGRTMEELPVDTRSLIVDVSQRDLLWHGVGDVASTGTTNVLVWPAAEECRFTSDVERRTDMAFGVFGRHFMVVGGRSLGTDQVPHTFVGDLTTGAIERLTFGLSTRRIRPTITEFGTDTHGLPSALVAGGSDPDSDAPLEPGTAEVYVPGIGASSDVGDFAQQKIDLSEPRTQHGAIVLTSGETLLVGGRGTAGPLRTMEIVDPVTRRTRTAGVQLLTVPRISPTVVRLASGEILVAGGVDAKGAAIPTLEWFSPDVGTVSKRPADLVTGKERAFVPLEGGGALAVILPESPTPDFKTVWLISAEGVLEAATPIDPTTLTSVRLFRGAEGAPVLWTGSAWLRWSPWTGSFLPLAAAPATGPLLDEIDSGDSGLALWLEDRDAGGLNVTGFRFAAHSRFGAVLNPLITNGALQLAPDRLAGFASSTLRFDERGLVLGAGATAFVTDLTFASFVLDVSVTGQAPVIVMRDERGTELEVGGVTCAFGQSATRTLHVVRKGRVVEVSADGAAVRTCPTELADGARVSVGLRGAQTTADSAARDLRIVRF